MICKAHLWYNEHLAPTGMKTTILLNFEPEKDSEFSQSSYQTINNFIMKFEKEAPELLDLLVQPDSSKQIESENIFEEVQ